MGFFSGPSKYVTLRMAQGVANFALQLKILRDLPAEDQKSILEAMRSQGAPTSMEELISSAASVIIQHKIWTWKKSQFLGMIRATMISSGMSPADAAYLTGMIELDDGIPRQRTKRQDDEVSPPHSEPKPPTPEEFDKKPAVEEPARSSTQWYGFKSGEFIVYPAHGVGQILAIEEQEIAGSKLELFVINFIKDKMTLRVPTSKFANVGMRKLSEPSMIRQAQEALSQRAHVGQGGWGRLAREYEVKINSGDIVAIAEVVRDLYKPAVNPGQSYSERQLYEAALDRLSREIAIVHHITEADAVREIEGILIARPQFAK
jgi:CarD family transcriptional regulator